MVKVKDPARVAAGRAAWARKSAAEKAKVRARLSKVRPGGTGKTKAVAKSTRAVSTRSNPGPPAEEKKNAKRRLPGVGRMYTDTKMGIMAAAPLTEIATRFPFSVDKIQVAGAEVYNEIAKDPVPVIMHEGIIAADRYLDKKMGQAGALSRRSLTAVLPEGYAALKGGLPLYGSRYKGRSARFRLREANAKLSVSQTGYNPIVNRSMYDDGTLHRYRSLKHGGQAVRWIANRTKIGQRVAAPFKKMLGSIGLSI